MGAVCTCSNNMLKIFKGVTL
uniref:Uncharacterized protein n=1 Tax=Rhizophora mucronata TaxID=61149 RepID=A0A2P2QGJ0_RHIMU